MAKAIASRLLHEPTVRMRRAAGNDDAYLYVSALRELFGLDVETEPEVEAVDGQRHRAAPQVRLGARRGAAHRHAGQCAGADPGRAGRRAARRGRAGRGLLRRRAGRQVALRARRSSGRCSPARPRSASTRPRTCRARWRRAWRSPPCRAREDPADVWIGAGASLEDVPEGARVGTASLRRRAQLLAARPDLRVEELHGNVDTRLRKLAEGELDAIVLAAAGLRRLGRESEIGFAIPADADGPGRRARARWRCRCAPATRRAPRPPRPAARSGALRELTAERAAVAPLDASCATPIGVHARIDGERLDESRPSSASPTAASGSATASRPTPPSPPPPARASPSACSPPAPASSSTAPRRPPASMGRNHRYTDANRPINGGAA